MKPEVLFMGKGGQPVLYMPLQDGGIGEIIEAGNIRGADIARMRLRAVVRRDREAAQEGRWVKLRPHFRELMEWKCMAARNLSVAVDPLPPRPVTDPRPRYRFEIRR